MQHDSSSQPQPQHEHLQSIERYLNKIQRRHQRFECALQRIQVTKHHQPQDYYDTEHMLLRQMNFLYNSPNVHKQRLPEKTRQVFHQWQLAVDKTYTPVIPIKRS